MLLNAKLVACRILRRRTITGKLYRKLWRPSPAAVKAVTLSWNHRRNDDAGVRSWLRHEVLPIVSDSVRGDGAIDRGGKLEAPDNLG